MMFADDIVLCSDDKGGVEEELEGWRYAFERLSMEISRGKTEYLCVKEEGEDEGGASLEGTDRKKVPNPMYLPSRVDSSVGSGTEVQRRI